MSALPPKQTWTPSYLVLISGTASYKRLRYYSGSLSYQFGKAATKLDIKNLFDAIQKTSGPGWTAAQPERSLGPCERFSANRTRFSYGRTRQHEAKLS